MRTLSLLLLGVVAVSVAGCADLPERGFGTRFLTKSVVPTLQDAFVPTTGFDGEPLRPTPAPVAPPPASVVAGTARVHAPPGENCTDVAKNRASDVSLEGFGEDVQKQVYDNAYSDCTRWQTRQ
jgi:hypothetical protein